jgi:hypothetical protein
MYRMRSFGQTDLPLRTYTAQMMEQPIRTFTAEYQQPLDTQLLASCLNPELVETLGRCFTGAVPAGMNPEAFAAACEAAKTQGYMDLPLCPGYPLPEFPGCLDPSQQYMVGYCKEHGSDGPDGASNAICWAVLKEPAWFAQYADIPHCGEIPNGKGEGVSTAVMWGGLFLLLAVGGGVTYYYVKKKG